MNRSACQKDWTVLIYMAADDRDIAPFALWNIYDMETPLAGGSAASTIDADVLVSLDLVEPRGVYRMHLFSAERPSEDGMVGGRELFTGAEAFTRLRSPIVEYSPSEGDAPEDSLRAFVDWGLRRYPSDKIMLILWGHGAGWRARDSPALTKPCPGTPSSSVDFLADGGFGPDCSEGTVFDIPTLARVARELAGERREEGRTIDVLVNDACLLQTVEITTELADAARYIVGYEQVAPHAGLPYRRLIPHLNGSVDTAEEPGSRCGPTHEAACELAARMPEIYRAAVDDGFYAARIRGTTDTPVAQTYTISTVDTAALSATLVPALDELGDALVQFLDEDPLRAIAIHVILRPGGLRGFQGETRDLGMFLTRLAQVVDEAELQGSTAGVRRLRAAHAGARVALERAVLGSAHGSDYGPSEFPDGFGGLAAWLPKCKTSLFAGLPEFQRSRLYVALQEGPEYPWERWLEATLGPQPGCD